jgi:rhamnosyltransferase
MSSSELHAGTASARTSRSQRALAGAVVVFYHPDVECFIRANRLAAILPVIVVDNTPGASAEGAEGLDPSIHYLASGINAGIATALNQGVDALRARGFGYALLFDQDSEPSASLLSGLLDAVRALAGSGRKVAVVGPAYEDARLSGVAPFVRFGAWRMTRVAPVGTEPLQVDFLISSGSCIDLSAWLAVGPMDASLFIDFVDVEWCVRARRAGFSVLGLPWLTMQHSLGDEPASLMGRRFAMHSPFRHYFLFRNALALILYRRYMPLSWKLAELIKFPVRIVLYPLLSEHPVEQLKMIGRGIMDGMRNRLGPLH